MANRSSDVYLYKMSLDDRIAYVRDFAGLDEAEVELLRDCMREFPPLAFGTHYRINGRDYIVPLVTEEHYVAPAACNGGELTRTGGISADYSGGSYTLGQVQLLAPEPEVARENILANQRQLLDRANAGHSYCQAEKIEAKIVGMSLQKGPQILVELLVNTGDAMGAMVTTSMAEVVAPELEHLTGGKVYARILSNRPVGRLVRARTTVPKEVFETRGQEPEEVIRGIGYVQALAEVNEDRAITHNKGIMNGVIAVLAATLNDTRAAYAAAEWQARQGGYRPLSRWQPTVDGDLFGELELPVVCGIKGRPHSAVARPKAQLARKILGIGSAAELAQIAGSVGLATNLAALYKLATEGISPGHARVDAQE